MGVDISATHTVFFIAAIVIAVGVIGIFNGTVQDFTNQARTRGGALSDEFATDIRIASDAGSMKNNPVIVHVLNTGTRTLAAGEAVVFVDGTPYTTVTRDVLGTTDDENWRPGDVLQITVTGLNLANGDHRVKVVTDNGVADTLKFNL